MKKVACGLFVSAFAVTSAFGGTVDFVGGAVDANTHVYDIVVSATDFAAFDSVGMLLGTDDASLPVSYSVEYDQAFLDSTAPTAVAPAEFFVYAMNGGSDLFFGGFNASEWSAPLTVATLTVDVSRLGAQEATLWIDSDHEDAMFGFHLTEITGTARASEGLSGSVTVPEPATLMLLGLGGLAVMRRRK